MKDYIRNVILVMSGGVGSRFGADCPKQYCMMNNRMVIDYVMDACRKTKGVDAIVVVAAGEYVDYCAERYGVPAVSGGATRPESVANGLKYVHDHYDCEKLIITNAVCPLATSQQYARYFAALDEYDYVLTTWKLAPALHRFDGVKCDRDEYFNVMEPDAYRFKMLYDNFDFASLKKYIFHNMPDDAKPLFCMDYPYTMKLTHPHDLKLLKVMYDEIVARPDQSATFQVVNNFLTSGGSQGVVDWISNVQKYIEEYKSKYRLTYYLVNAQTEENIVYEAHSESHGDIIIKFTPSDWNFNKERLYYMLAPKGITADLIAADADYNALVIKTVKPGYQVSVNARNPELLEFFKRVSENLIPEEAVKDPTSVPNVYDEFFIFKEGASGYTYEAEFRAEMEKKALRIWDVYFRDAPKYYLHRDLHRRNLLKSGEGIRAIDSRGAIGPKAFEFVIQFIIELRDFPDGLNESLYNELFDFFTQFVDADELRAALFFFWVYKMDDYVYHKNDNYRLSSWCKKCILKLYFEGVDDPCVPGVFPFGLKKLSK